MPSTDRAWAHVPEDVLAPFRTAAVTGGSGFVGRHLVTALADHGVRVRVVDLVAPDVPLPGAEFHQADLRDPAATAEALGGVDVVFHLAGNPSGTRSLLDPRFDFRMNVEATFNVAEACARSRTRLVHQSAASVYGPPTYSPTDEAHAKDPILPYGAHKLCGEAIIRGLVKTWHLPASIARPFVIYGPGEDPRRAEGEVSQFLRWHLNGKPIPAVGDIDRKSRDFVHVEDMVSGLLYVAGRAEPGEAVNVGSGTDTSLRELARTIGEVTGSEAVLEADATVLDDSYALVGDIGRARVLGYSPHVTLHDGIAALARELGDRPELPSITSSFQKEAPQEAPENRG
ncbi:NAD-dependent epimerase/dehydratase family protein [Streptomyces sp. NPDC093546]|uniref:NAD-dependent epimerase/dehydratase family protein n=1 Tax=Streptomyces sp. NPDC093546 TaxID=3366040 RepID=UPI0038305F74